MTFRIGDCRVSVGFLFLAVLALLLAADRSGAAAAGLVCAALHEAAHLAAMGALGGMPRQIRFTPFGIDIVKPCDADRSYPRDILISLAGPLANFAAALCFSIFGTGCFLFTAANFFLFAFNILPIEPLDGGQALFALLCMRMEPGKAGRIVAAVSFFVLVPLAAAGFLLLFRSRWNFSLLFACIYLMILLVMKKERLE